jgi:methionyl-tRNA synthetase
VEDDQDRQAGAAMTLYVALTVISGLRTALYPFLPFSSQKLHEYLGFEGKVETTAGSCAFHRRGNSFYPRSLCLPSWTKK